MSAAKKSWNVVQLFARKFSAKKASKSEVKEVTSSKFASLKLNQQKFQVDDGVPIYLKGGVKDKILFQITLLGLIVGLAMSVQTLTKAILPRK